MSRRAPAEFYRALLELRREFPPPAPVEVRVREHLAHWVGKDGTQAEALGWCQQVTRGGQPALLVEVRLADLDTMLGTLAEEWAHAMDWQGPERQARRRVLHGVGWARWFSRITRHLRQDN